MKKRPVSITVISWYLIVSAILLVLFYSFALSMTIDDMKQSSTIPVSIQFPMLYAGLLMTLVSGIAMLKGQNWARLLYVIWCGILVILALATSPNKSEMVTTIVFWLIIVFFLFRPKANEYFSSTEPQVDAKSN